MMAWRRMTTWAPLVIMAAVSLASCSDQGPNVGLLAELQLNRDLWERQGPPSYIYAVERLCFCAGAARGPVRVTVQGSTVLERDYVDTGEPVPETLADLFPTVEGLFDLVASAIAGGAYSVQVDYDEASGVPITIQIDYQRNVADEELGMRVTEAVQALGP